MYIFNQFYFGKFGRKYKNYSHPLLKTMILQCMRIAQYPQRGRTALFQPQHVHGALHSLLFIFLRLCTCRCKYSKTIMTFYYSELFRCFPFMQVIARGKIFEVHNCTGCRSSSESRHQSVSTKSMDEHHLLHNIASNFTDCLNLILYENSRKLSQYVMNETIN